MPKNVKKRPLGFFNIHSVTKYQTNRRHSKIFEEKFQCRKNLKVIASFFSLVRFCMLRLKKKQEKGTLCTEFPLAGLGRSSSLVVLVVL